MFLKKRVFLIIWIIVSIFIIVALLQNIIHAKESSKRLRELEERNRVKQEQVAILEKKYEKINDPYEKERIIREELNMQKPGEVILGIPEDRLATQSGENIDKLENRQNANVIQSILLWIKGKLGE